MVGRQLFGALFLLPVLLLCQCASPSPDAAKAPLAFGDLDYFYRLAHFLNPAYCSESLDSWSCKPCLSPNTANTSFIDLIGNFYTSAFGYIAVNTRLKLIILVFRGTLSADNFAHDLMLLNPPMVRPFPGDDERNQLIPEGMSVHFGFWNEWNRVRNETLLKINSRISYAERNLSNYNFLVSGHSMGAAIAVLAALDISTLSKSHPSHIPAKKIIVLTAGEPRVGNIVFSQWFTQQNFSEAIRVVHKSDLIPHLPIFSFSHREREVWIDEKGVTWTCENPPENTFKNTEHHQQILLGEKRSGIRDESPLCANSVNPIMRNMFDHMRLWDLRNFSMLDKFPKEILHLSLAPALFSIRDFVRLTSTCRTLSRLRFDSLSLLDLVFRLHCTAACDCVVVCTNYSSPSISCISNTFVLDMLNIAANNSDLELAFNSSTSNSKTSNCNSRKHILSCSATLTSALIISCRLSQVAPMFNNVAKKALSILVKAMNLDSQRFTITNKINSAKSIIPPLFLFAVSENNLPLVKAFVSCSKAESVFDIDLNRALQVSSAAGYTAMVEYLIAAGSDIHFNKNIALRHACFYDRGSVVRILLSQGADMSCDDGEPLQFSAAHGYVGLVELLLTHHRNTSPPTEVAAGINKALRHAVRCGHTAILKQLLYHGANPRTIDITSADSGTMFQEALKNQSLEVTQILFSSKYPPQINFTMAKLMVQRYATVDTANSRTKERLINELVHMVLAVQPTSEYDPKGLLPWACLSGDLRLIKMLLKMGAVVQNEAVINATRIGSLAILKHLVDSGAKLDCEVWWEAITFGQVEILEFYLDWANSVFGKDGWPLITDNFFLHAVACGNAKLIRTLLNIRQIQYLGKQLVHWIPKEALKIAAMNGHVGVIDLFVVALFSSLSENNKFDDDNNALTFKTHQNLNCIGIFEASEFEIYVRSAVSGAKRNGHFVVVDIIQKFK
ncbi:hypothetical protein HK096_005191 [Nowakowskiella sp. JEL0078]|nr:hypothetical protein HK096_005191 [Nowakowskiella sp. JEL0078]